MKKINFVTGNKGKVKSLEGFFESRQIPVEINQIKLDLIEPQLNDVESVSKHKAKQAFDILGEPVLVEDGGFCVEALKGFPGAYARYMLDTIGVEGLIKMMEGEKNRNCKFISTATFIDENGNSYSFNDTNKTGILRNELVKHHCPHALSDIWFVYEIPGLGKTLSALTKEELHSHYKNSDSRKSGLEVFVDWLEREFKNNTKI